MDLIVQSLMVGALVAVVATIIALMLDRTASAYILGAIMFFLGAASLLTGCFESGLLWTYGGESLFWAVGGICCLAGAVRHRTIHQRFVRKCLFIP